MQGPEVKDAEAEVKEPATGITLQVQLDGGKHIVLQSFIGRDASIAQYHGLTDKLYRVVERQQWKSDILSLKLALDVDERGLKAQEADFLRIDENNATQWKMRGKKGDPQLSGAEETAKLNSGTNIKRFREEIDKKKVAIKELEDKLKLET